MEVDKSFVPAGPALTLGPFTPNLGGHTSAGKAPGPRCPEVCGASSRASLGGGHSKEGAASEQGPVGGSGPPLGPTLWRSIPRGDRQTCFAYQGCLLLEVTTLWLAQGPARQQGLPKSRRGRVLGEVSVSKA